MVFALKIISIAALALSALFLIISVVLWFRFDIVKIIGILTGRYERKAIENKKKNITSEKKPHTAPRVSETSERTRAAKTEHEKKTSESEKRKELNSVVKESEKATAPAIAAPQAVEATTLLSENQSPAPNVTDGGTTVLAPSAPAVTAGGTTVLAPSAPAVTAGGTTVLTPSAPAVTAGGTTVLTPSAPAFTAGGTTVLTPSTPAVTAGGTTVLAPSANPFAGSMAKAPVNFASGDSFGVSKPDFEKRPFMPERLESIETVIFVHTSEIIR